MNLELLTPILAAASILGIVVCLVILWRQRAHLRFELAETARFQAAAFREAARSHETALRAVALELARGVEYSRSETLRALSQDFQGLSQLVGAALMDNREKQIATTQELQRRIGDHLERIRADSAQQLDKMRATVEEKLQSTLEARLGESFKQVSERLEQVYRGLGEMQTLATGVGDLKRVLTNVRTRGTFGEAQLEALLEQVLVSSQYDKNVATIPGSSERVEFAVRLPGDDDGTPVYLPIDAKFPVEDYERLIAAYAANDLPGIEEHKKSLRRRVIDEAEKIRKKYVAPPHTTEVALMYLPNEGLYAEVLRFAGMIDALQTLKIVPVGPSTLYAVLNSLQMGFRTIAIQKRTHEVWSVLGAVKTEFGKFGDVLGKVREKLDQASKKLGETEIRTRAIERSLRQVEALPEAETAKVFPELPPLG